MATYVSNKECPSLKIPGVLGTNVKFENCCYETDDAAMIVELDRLIEKAQNIRMLIRKVDRDAAVQVALQHQSKQMAAKGPFSSEHIHAAHQDELKARDANLALLSSDPEAAAKMSEQIRETDLQLTENSAGKVAPAVTDGFIPETQKPATNVDASKMMLGTKKAK